MKRWCVVEKTNEVRFCDPDRVKKVRLWRKSDDGMPDYKKFPYVWVCYDNGDTQQTSAHSDFMFQYWMPNPKWNENPPIPVRPDYRKDRKFIATPGGLRELKPEEVQKIHGFKPSKIKKIKSELSDRYDFVKLETDIDLFDLRDALDRAFIGMDVREMMFMHDISVGVTLSEISRKTGLCRERVRQISAKAFRKMRGRERLRYLKDFVFLKDRV